MRLVVADTGPLNYLVLIEASEILPKLFDAIIVPEAVKAELVHPSAPAAGAGRARKTPPTACGRAAPGSGRGRTGAGNAATPARSRGRYWGCNAQTYHCGKRSEPPSDGFS